MNNNPILDKIIKVYESYYLPYANLTIRDLKTCENRIYLTHKENDTVISLLPMDTHDNGNRKKN